MVTIIHDIQKMKSISRSDSIGFVPTMGNLHSGHLSLVNKSRAENAKTVVSIFVNPTQFNDKNDFARYPRTFEQDLKLLEEAQVDYLFAPEPKAMYPDDYTYSINENKLSERMEGKHRPGHFQGMLTVVMKLLLIVRPSRAYFGEKDFQQYQLICGMAKAFFLDTNIIACPTIREASGLAFSSRNNLLSDTDRTKAALFFQLLSSKKSCSDVISELQKNHFKVDYVEEYENRRFGAIYINGVRLIDNVPV